MVFEELAHKYFWVVFCFFFKFEFSWRTETSLVFIVWEDWKGLLTHGLERGVLVQVLAGRLLLVRAAELAHIWIRLLNQARRLGQAVHRVDVWRTDERKRLTHLSLMLMLAAASFI